MLKYIDKLSDLPGVLEVLIGTLTRFFAFAADFQPESQDINKTTHTSSYTYWFLVLSAKILTNGGLLSEELQKRHEYLLAVIATRLGEGEVCDYLCLTAAIYAGAISTSSAVCSSHFGGNFLRAVTRHRDRFKGDLSNYKWQLRRAVKANEVAWGAIDHALESLGPSDTAFVPDSAGANDTMAERPPLSRAYDRDLALGQGRASSGVSMDHGESAFLACRLSYLNGLCITRLCSHTKWWYIYSHSWRGLISALIPGRGQSLWIWEKFRRRRLSGMLRYHYRFTTLYIGATICKFPSYVYFVQHCCYAKSKGTGGRG
jgi:hypothetical protein